MSDATRLLWRTTELTLTNHRTWDEILTALKVEGPLRVGAVAGRLGVTNMAARQHLSGLAAAGLITVSQMRSTVGRPAHLYQLSPKGEKLFPRAYAAFALDMLDRAAESKGIEWVDHLLAAQWSDFTSQHIDRMDALPLTDRVQELASIQTKQGFMAIVKDTGDRLELIEHNCSMQCVAVRYPQLCRHELTSFCALLGAEVERTECIAEGDRRCRYLIKTE